MVNPTFQIFHTLRDGDDPLKTFLSAEGDYMAVIFRRGSAFEIYSRLTGVPWMAVAGGPLADGEDYGRLQGILWHPFLPRQLLLIYNFVIQNIAFIDEGQVDVMNAWHLPPALNNLVHGIANACVNDTASEISFFIEHSIFTLRDPFSTDVHSVEHYQPVPERLCLHTGHENIALWYIDDDIVVGVYPLGYFATSTLLPHKVQWQIIVSPARMMSSACISPDKHYSVAITKDGQADLYCMKEHCFLRTFGGAYGHYKYISAAVFCNRKAIVFSCKDSSVLIVIPNFSKPDQAFVEMTQLGPDDEPGEAPLALYGGGMIAGDGYVFTFKGGPAPFVLINVDEFSGVKSGRFEIDTWQHWMNCPPHIPLTNLDAPLAVAVAVTAPRLHPVAVLVRDVVRSLHHQHIVAAAVAGVGLTTAYIKYIVV